VFLARNFDFEESETATAFPYPLEAHQQIQRLIVQPDAIPTATKGLDDVILVGVSTDCPSIKRHQFLCLMPDFMIRCASPPSLSGLPHGYVSQRVQPR
jgi:hypothetical protein